MKTRVSNEVPSHKIESSLLHGKQLVYERDGMGYVVYQIKCEGNVTHQLISPYGMGHNHIYYVLSGEGDILLDDGSVLKIYAHSLVAMTGDIIASLLCEKDVCLLAVFAPSDPTNRSRKVLLRHLDELIGTERDVDWTTGRSRRFLIKSDGFNVTVTNTTADSNTKSNLQYRNHFEAVCWYKGVGRYEWNGGQMKQEFDLENQNEDSADLNVVAMVMNEHDSHLVDIEKSSVAVCVFSPPLMGLETHNLSSSNFSTY